MTPLAAALLVAIGLAAIALLVITPWPIRVRLVERRGDGVAVAVVARPSLTTRFGVAVLHRTVGATRVEQALLGAGVRTSAPEFAALTSVAALAALTIAAALRGPLAGLLAAAAVPACAWLYVSRRRSGRASAFAEQLPTTLQTLVASLRAGYSLPQALDSVTESGFAPTSEEFERMLQEVRVGRPLGPALLDLGQRMRSDDFDWVVTALDINKEVGGDLSEVLETVERTIRERESLRRNIRSLSAEGRVSAVIIFLLPFVTLGLIAITNPDYVRIFTTERVGMIMAGVATVLMAIGGLWLRAMIKVKM
jgi:tight adherence protein B